MYIQSPEEHQDRVVQPVLQVLSRWIARGREGITWALDCQATQAANAMLCTRKGIIAFRCLTKGLPCNSVALRSVKKCPAPYVSAD